MESLTNYILESLSNELNITDQELNVLYDNFKKKYNIDLSKKSNIKFIDLYKDVHFKGSFKHLWISFMNDPNNHTKHVEPYFFGIYSTGSLNKFSTIDFFECSKIKNKEIQLNIKNQIIKHSSDIINKLQPFVFKHDTDIIKFINSFSVKKINEGALQNRQRNISNLSKKIEKLYNLLETLWKNNIEFHIDEFHNDKLSKSNIYSNLELFYKKHYSELQEIYKNENIILPKEIIDIEDENIYNEIVSELTAIMYNNNLIDVSDTYYETLFDSSIMNNINELYDYIDSLKKGILSKDYELSIINFKELEDICKTEKNKKYFYIYKNKCSINFKRLIDNIDDIITIIL